MGLEVGELGKLGGDVNYKDLHFGGNAKVGGWLGFYNEKTEGSVDDGGLSDEAGIGRVDSKGEGQTPGDPVVRAVLVEVGDGHGAVAELVDKGSFELPLDEVGAAHVEDQATKMEGEMRKEEKNKGKKKGNEGRILLNRAGGAHNGVTGEEERQEAMKRVGLAIDEPTAKVDQGVEDDGAKVL